MKKVIAVLLLSTSFASVASHESGPSLFYKTESYGKNKISSVGTSILITGNESSLGLALNTSVGAAEVYDDYGYLQEYLAWEGGIKVGYFSKVFFYAEAGVDLGELIFDDRDEDEHFYFEDEHHHYNDDYYDYVSSYNDDNHVDAYVGVGAGINLGRLQIEAFSRVRNIDGIDWDAPQHTYSGVQFSLKF